MKKRRISLIAVLVCVFALVLSLGIMSACGNESASTETESTAEAQWLYGTEAPADNLGKAGDYYLDTYSLRAYVRAANGEWEPTALYSGAEAPEPTDGATGDLYLDTKNGVLYQKGDTLWQVVMKLEKGENGRDGVVWFSGAKDPEEGDTTLKDARSGDFYLNTNGFTVWQLDADGTWIPLGAIKGDPGKDSVHFYNGVGEPVEGNPSNPVEGDLYIGQFSGLEEGGSYSILYRYHNGAWLPLMESKNEKRVDIYSYSQLLAFAVRVSNGTDDYQGKEVHLKVDIDFDAPEAASIYRAAPRATEDWAPIGTEEHPFRGTFDGEGHSVEHFTAKTTDSAKAAGFFGYVEGATIEHLHFVGAEVTADLPDAVAGVVVGQAKGEITVKDVTVLESSVAAAEGVENATVGALVGASDGTVTAADVEVQTEGEAALVGSIPYGALTTDNVTVKDESGETKELTCVKTGAHSYMNGACELCGEIMPFVGENGTGSNDGYFVLTSIVRTEDGEKLKLEEIYVPSVINGLPVIFRYNQITGAFKGYETVKKLTFEDGITEIGTGTFAECPNLEEIHLPEGITVIHKKTIANLPKLKTIEIPASVEEIDEQNVYQCAAITSVTFAEGSHLKAIRRQTFCYSEMLASVDLPDNPLEIGPGNTTLGASENGAAGLLPFYDTAISGKTTAFDGPGWVRDENSSLKVLYVGKHLISVRWDRNASGKDSILTIKEDTISIAVGAACPSLFGNTAPNNTELVIPDSVKFIGGYAFYLARSSYSKNVIERVVIGSSVEHIGSMAFAGRSDKLTSAEFRNTENWVTATRKGTSFPWTDVTAWNDAADPVKAAAALTADSHTFFLRQV